MSRYQNFKDTVKDTAKNVGKNVGESIKNLGSKINTDATTNILQLTQNISQNAQSKYIIFLICILIFSGISYGLIHKFIGNEWLFSVFLILILAFAATLRFIINISTFMTATKFEHDNYHKYDLREPPRKIIHPGKIKTTKIYQLFTSSYFYWYP